MILRNMEEFSMNEAVIKQMQADIEELKKENAELREMCKKNAEMDENTRDVLDSNIIAIYDDMFDKTNTTCLVFSSIFSCILVIAAEVLLAHGADESKLIVCCGILFVMTAIMCLCTIILVWNFIKQIRKTIKNREWENWKMFKNRKK